MMYLLLIKREVNKTKPIIKSLSLILTLALIACTALTSGCTEGGNQTDDNNGQIDAGRVALENITNIRWQWAGLTGNSSADQSVVPKKESYTLEFLPDGVYYINTDCNSGSGNYTTDGRNLTIGPGVITLVYCGEDSLEPQYLSLLSSVTSMALEDGQLLLSVGDDSEKMLFIDPESVKH